MLCTIPDYYKEFSCIAGDCEDTCCAGWQIVIDEKSKRRYAKAATGLNNIEKNLARRAAPLCQLARGRIPSGYGKALCIFKPE